MMIVGKTQDNFLKKKELSRIKCKTCGEVRDEIDFVRIVNRKRKVDFDCCNFCYNKFSRLKSQPGNPLDVSAIIENKIFSDCKERFFSIMDSEKSLKINGLSENDGLLFVSNGHNVFVYQGNALENQGNILTIWFIYHKLLKNYWGDEQKRYGNNNYRLIFKGNKKKFYD